MSGNPDLTAGRCYAQTTFMPDSNWFGMVDVCYRYSLPVVMHYWLMITHPISYPIHNIHYWIVWYGLIPGLIISCFYFVLPIFIIVLEVLKRIHQFWVPDWSQAGPGAVFFKRPKNLIASFIWDAYTTLGMSTALFFMCGYSPDAIQHSLVDVITTKNYWRALLEDVGARVPLELGHWKDGKLEMHHDIGKSDIVMKVENSYLGIGDKFMTNGVEFSTVEDLDKICKEEYEGQEVLALEIVRPIKSLGVHSLDIVTIATANGPKVLTVLIWNDCTGTSSHTSRSGYCIDVKTSKIVSPCKWYSPYFASMDVKHLGTKVPGVEEACRSAIAAHTKLLETQPWMRMVGFDCMIMRNEQIVFFEGNFAAARFPRRVFLSLSNMIEFIWNVKWPF
jgi:hypothetical protein